ncbi:putative glycosyltransferase [Candidatus Sulfobium mesophilum]|uniref:dolichyl-phosphate beta-glucosyltransferase n=1 Tax=Candidatus Sulfobium mesophilum TaxID=2016548 RepID=A0A2U3QEU1_9BACT|nr:putative glycosyltransferase [Candidatus Sulfobium mesophilum]
MSKTDRQNTYDSYGNPPSRVFLSIIIPAFNEEERLPDTLTKVVEFVESQMFIVEAIVVDNASTDRTAAIVADFASRYPFIRYLFEARRGKGAAVKTGMLSGHGDYLLISDADLAVPITEVREFLQPMRDNYDIAIGSREIKGAVRYNEPFHRHLMGRVFNLIVRLLVLPGLRDTQCGFKGFRRDVARDLFSASRIDGWSFDVEILCMAQQKGYRIIEVPVDWFYGEKSKINPARDAWVMLKDIIRIRQDCRR